MASSDPDPDPDFDLDTVDFALDAMPGAMLHRVLKGFRERGPVQPTRFMGIPSFVITGHEALLDAFKDVDKFPPHLMYKAGFEGAIGESFISMESPQRHRTYRKLATPAFRSRAVESYEKEGLAATAHELADALKNRSEFDLMADFAAQFPYLVITRLLGLPREREEDFHHWALALLQFRDDPVAAKKASSELTEFLAPVVAARRRKPENDVISELVAARVDDRGLTDDEVFSHVRLLFPTGGETTHGSLGNLIYALLTHAGAWEMLRQDPSRIGAAVDELLRWETPIAVLPRMSRSAPVDFHGTQIPADSWVLFAIAGANRDPSIFQSPDHFEIGRNTQESLSFGRGVKACPGMHLARRNLCVAIEVLLQRFPGLELLDIEAATPKRTVLRCPDALRVRKTVAS